MLATIKRAISFVSFKVVDMLWKYPAVGHGVAAFIAVLVGAVLGVPTHVAAAVSAFYWGREMTQAKIWTLGYDARPITDWSKNPNGIVQAAVPTAVAAIVAGLWLWVF